MIRTSMLLCFITLLMAVAGCTAKPSEDVIKQKILSAYICGEEASIDDLKILKTEETKSTNGPHVFTYAVQGTIEWLNGCTTMGSNILAGTKEKIEKTVTLTETEKGWQ